MMTMKRGWRVYKVLPTRIHMANQEADTMKINLKVSANISFNCLCTSYDICMICMKVQQM